MLPASEHASVSLGVSGLIGNVRPHSQHGGCPRPAWARPIMPEVLASFQSSTAWAEAVFFLLGVAGGLLVVNLFVPSGFILAASGALIGVGTLSWAVAVWAGAGVVLGCSVSYVA